MRSSANFIRTALAVGAAAALPASFSTSALAQQFPSINEPPKGAGTEQPAPQGTPTVHPGIEADVGLGTGFSDTYGLGVQGRVGYTWHNGIYAGGAAQYFAGHSVNSESAHATFVGGELGYKFFPTYKVEIRPYLFAGPAFVTQVNSNPLTVDSKTAFGLQPGALAMYHFGHLFVGGDARFFATPTPTTLAVFASGGFGF